ncbi:MAG: hypothetical protein Q9183_003802 [Haloplaca sp. 2 TL-2023]
MSGNCWYSYYPSCDQDPDVEGFNPVFMTAQQVALSNPVVYNGNHAYAPGAYAPAEAQIKPTAPSSPEGAVRGKRALSQSTDSGDEAVEGNSSFKRVGKRSRNAEMEKEIQELRRELANQRSHQSSDPPSIKAPPSDTASPRISSIPSQLDQYINSEQAVNSLMDLRSGIDGAAQQELPIWRLEGITISSDQVQTLFRRFFDLFHPYMPLLDPSTSPVAYHKSHPLLFWVIISVAARHYPPDTSLLTNLSAPISHLLWATLADVPQNHVVVKALCILCTWPLPISTTSLDPTFMLAGTMMQISLQIGLHRPSFSQDFSRYKVQYREEELGDRVKTWVACNMVSQRVSTGYGQPPSTVYDWTLSPTGWSGTGYQLPREVEIRLDIEKFCNKVMKSMYTNKTDAVGLVDDGPRSVLSDLLASDFEDIEGKIMPGTSSMSCIPLALLLSPRISSSCGLRIRV